MIKKTGKKDSKGRKRQKVKIFLTKNFVGIEKVLTFATAFPTKC